MARRSASPDDSPHDPKAKSPVPKARKRLANRPIPAVGLMTRDVFKNVYALTQEEALGLDPRAWQHVQDRVLGGSSYDFLRPSREVVSALDAERRRLWRPDRRGRPEAREIAAEIRELRDGLREASQRRLQIERNDDRIDEISADLEKEHPGASAHRTGPGARRHAGRPWSGARTAWTN